MSINSPIRAIALFCEDIREEKSETDSIVGVLPDNVRVARFPISIPKLAIYLRMQVMPDAEPGEISVWLELPDGGSDRIAGFEPADVEKVQEIARREGKPFAGFVMRSKLIGFQLREEGLIKAVVRSSYGDLVCGFLKIVSPASASEQPSEQFVPAAPAS